MSQILIDGITNVTIAHGLVRVECVVAGPNKEQRPSGTLLIPAAQAAPVLNALVNAMKELQRKQQEQEQGAPPIRQ
jgi:hypothetical protein